MQLHHGHWKKRKLNSKTNDQINKSLYNWIIYHPQVVQSPIVNDSLLVNKYMVTLNHNLLQNCQCRSPSENLITALLVAQKMVDSKSQ